MFNQITISDEALFNANVYFAYRFIEEKRANYDIVTLYEVASEYEQEILAPYLNELLERANLPLIDDLCDRAHDEYLLPSLSDLLNSARESWNNNYTQLLSIIFEFNNGYL